MRFGRFFRQMTSVCLAGLLLCSGAAIPNVSAGDDGMGVENLRTEYRTTPLGLDTSAPRLSWTLHSDTRGDRQTAYQIIVSEDAEDVAAGKGDCWDSGKVFSEQSYDIIYAGDALKPKTRYYWAVRVWDREGSASEWSAVTWFETALFSEEDWTAEWITVEDQAAGLYPVKTFSVEATAARFVKLDVTKLGYNLPGDSYRLQLAEIQVMDTSGKNVALGAAVTVKDNFGNGWWQKEYLVDGAISSAGGDSGYSSDGYGSRDVNLWITLDLGAEYDLKEVRIYGRNDADSSAPPALANFPASFTIQTAGADEAYTIACTAVDENPPEYSDVDLTLPIFGKAFSVSGEVERARVYCTGLGLFQLNVNGEAATEALYEPGETNFDKTCYYVTYDVTDKLLAGENAMGVYLGKGFYYNVTNSGRYNRSEKAWGPLLLRVQLEITYTDGRTQVVNTDQTWRYTKGPLAESCWLGGEDYVAANAHDGFDRPGYDYTGWETPLLVEKDDLPFERLTAKAYPSITVQETLEAVSVTQLEEEVFLVDLGRNFAGTFSFTGTLEAGQRVEFWPAEVIYDTGYINTTAIGSPIFDSYTADQDGEVTYSPKFNYHGFRYLEVHGLRSLTAEQIRGYVVHCDNAETGVLNTDSEVVNAIHTIIRRSIADNMYNVLTDCPQREKLGWMECMNLMYSSIAYNYDIAAWAQKFSNDIIEAQKDSGSVPSIVPPLTVGHGAHLLTEGPDDTPNDPSWCGSAVLYPWYTYQTYGNLAQLQKAWPSMQAYMEYLQTLVDKNEPYILEETDVNRLLGDWYATEQTSVTFVITLSYYQLVKTMVAVAEVLGDRAVLEQYVGLEEEVRQAVQETFYHASTHSYDTGSQTANGMPLYLGLVPESERPGVLESLVNSIVSNGYHLTSGEVGLGPVLSALSQNGYSDVAYRMVTNRTQPSYYYLWSIGKTTLTEAWSGADSQNHCMLGMGEAWLYRYLGGLENTGVGYDTCKIAPYLPDDMGELEVSVGTPYGTLSNHWTRTGDTVIYQISVPVGSTATVILPVDGPDAVTESGVPLSSADGVREVAYADGEVTMVVASGDYVFETQNTLPLNREPLESLVAVAGRLDPSQIIVHGTALEAAVGQAEALLSREDLTNSMVAEETARLQAVLESLVFKGNLALNKPVAAFSSIENGGNWSVDNLTDGDLINGTAEDGGGYTSSSDEYNSHSTEWVQVDLLSTQEIDRVVLWPRRVLGDVYTFPETFEILVSTDGAEWQTVVREQNYPLVQSEAQTFTFEPAKARYLRIRAIKLRPNPADGNRYRIQLAELEAYAPDGQSLEQAVAYAVANLGDLTEQTLTEEQAMHAARIGLLDENISVEWSVPFANTEGWASGELLFCLGEEELALDLTTLWDHRGDVDGDGEVTVSDVVELRKLIVKGSCTDRELAAGNLDDSDSDLTVSDVVALRALIVQG